MMLLACIAHRMHAAAFNLLANIYIWLVCLGPCRRFYATCKLGARSVHALAQVVYWLLPAFIFSIKKTKVFGVYIIFSWCFYGIKRDSKLELYFGFGCCWEVRIANLFHLPSVYSISLPIIIIFFSWVCIAKINRRLNKCTTRTAPN
jgi:hypothetical protein